ncbi:PAS domain S-box protein, partial [Candidatus Pacearchaeota archaeon]|nr:PAS domain S-box protein [Candidatus Pacearchaeota archaeon]
MEDMPMMHDSTHNGGDLDTYIKQFITIFAPLLILLLAIALSHFYTNRMLEHITQEADETLNVDLASKVINDKLRNVVTDLTFLTSLNELQSLLERSDDNQQRTHLAMELLAFSKNKGTYDQLRFMDTEGNEIVRINYNNGAPQVVPESQLQNKADRYYFQDAIALNKGGIYLSPFDLNMEKGVIEQPYKPVLRFATPLFDSHGRKKGLLTLNYLGAGLIQNFKQAAANISKHINLVNASGYWLSSPSPENEWGFMLDHKRSFSTSYPSAWEKIQGNNHEQFRNNDGLFTYTTIYPAESIIQISGITSGGTSLWQTGALSDQSRNWKIISHIPTERNITDGNFFSRHFLLYGSVGLLLLVSSIFLARASVRHHLIVAQNEYEQRFRKTLENIDLAAITMDMDGRIIFCNDFLLGITGWSRAEVINHNYLDIFLTTDDQAKAREFFSELASSEVYPSSIEIRIKTKDGRLRLLTWNNTLSYDPNGKVIALTCIGQDITEQRENEQQLHKLSSAVAQSTNPIMITDTIPRIEYVNPAFTHLTGYSAEEAIGRSPNILKSGETSKEEYKKLWHAVTSGNNWNGLFHNRKKSGELYWEYAAMSPIRDVDGNITNYLAVKEDVTKLKQLENEVK